MIVRSWIGYAHADRAADYPLHLLESVQPRLKTLPGFQGLYLLRRLLGREVEYRVLTLWSSMEAISAFAGPTPDTAVVEPEAQAVLARYDTHVEHYEVLAAPDA